MGKPMTEFQKKLRAVLDRPDVVQQEITKRRNLITSLEMLMSTLLGRN